MRSPVLETKLLLLAALLIWIAVILSTLKAYLSDSDQIGSTPKLLSRFELAMIGPFFIVLTLAFMLPNFKPTYFDILQLSCIVAINSATAFLFYFGVDLELTSAGTTSVAIPLFAGISFVISTVVFLYYFISRLLEVRSIRDKELGSIISTKEMTVIGSIAVFSLIFLLFVFRVNDQNRWYNFDLPSNTFLLPFSLVILLSAYFINKEESYPFVIPVKLYGIIITEKDTGLTILTKDYQDEIPTIELLGNLFTALDLSLQETIQSTKTIEDIIFGDKVVHIVTGNFISTIMIVSKNSLITKSLTKHLTHKFETMFRDQFSTPGMLDQNEFLKFESAFSEVRRYLPL